MENTKNVYENPNTNIKPLKWLTEEHFEKIVKNETPNFSKIVNFVSVAGTAPGENYGSLIYRVHIDVELNDGSIKKKSYMLKSMSTSEELKEHETQMRELFVRENELYVSLIPQFEHLYELKGKKISFGPKCYKLAKDPQVDILVLEDLKIKNFKNANRLEGLDMAHTKNVLAKLAAFHAASAYLYEKEGPYSKTLTGSVFDESLRTLLQSTRESVDPILKDSLTKHKILGKFCNKLVSSKKYVDLLIEISRYHPTDFNVINHGDCWVNNFMFQYNTTGDLEETYFIDFQIARWGSPAQDLYYFLLTSVNVDIKTKCFDYFIKYYHDHLYENLVLLGYSKPIPKLVDLHIDLLKYGFWGQYVATHVLGLIIADPDANANLDNFLKNDEEAIKFKRKLFSNPRYLQNMEEILPWLDNRGLLSL